MNKTINSRVFRFAPMLSLLGSSIVAGPVAAEFDAEFSAGIGFSDNISRSEDNETDESITAVGALIDWTESTRKLEGLLHVDVTYLNYLDNTFEEEIVGAAELDLNVELIEERLRWVLVDNFGQQLANPLGEPRPSNREHVNLLTTGPRLTIPLSTRTFIGIDALYQNNGYEVQPLDNESLSAAIRFGRDIRRNNTIALNASTKRIDYARDASLEVDINEAFVSYEGTVGRNTFNLNLGVAELDVGTDTAQSTLIRAQWTRQVSPYSTFTVDGSSEVFDQGDVFRFNWSMGQPDSIPQNVDGFGNPVQHYSFDLRFDLAKERTRLSAAVGWSQDDYTLGFNRDRDYVFANFSYERDLTRKVFTRAYLTFGDWTYKYVDDEFSDLRAGFAIGYRLSGAFRLDVEYNFAGRDGVDRSREFAENRLFLNFRYRPLWAR